jgi:hypothetical protein
MPSSDSGSTRRGFLATQGAALVGAVGLASWQGVQRLVAADPLGAATPAKPLQRIAAVNTVYRMRSLAQGGRPHSDAVLDIHYQAPQDSGFFRGRYTQAG